jgi:hypothetical protein
MNQKIKLIILTATYLLFISMDSFAQTRPAVHWSTFNKNANQCACHLFAVKALNDEGLKVMDDARTVIIAGNDKAVAEVVCLPGDRQIHVSAYSSDSDTAAWLRNNVRERIMKAVLFDTCP